MASTDGSSSIIVAVGLAIVYVALFKVGDDRRRHFHEKLFRTCRRFLADHFGMTHLRHLEVHACSSGPGWKVLPFAFAAVVLLLAIVYLFQGQLLLAANALMTTALYSIMTYYFKERRYVLMLARVLSAYQLVIVWNTPNYLEDPKTVFRGVLGRAIGSVVFFDALDESFIHMMAMTILVFARLGWSSPMCLLPLKIYVFFLLPIQILGVREWICSQRIFVERPAEVNRRFFLAVIVPLMTIIFSFTGGAEIESDHLAFLRLIGLGHVFLFVMCSIVGDGIDAMFGAEKAVQNLEEKLSDVLLDKPDESFNSKMISILDVVFIVTAATSVILHSLTLFFLMLALFIIGRAPFSIPFIPCIKAPLPPWRQIVFFAHCIMLARAVNLSSTLPFTEPFEHERLSPKHLTAVVILTTLRFLLAFERRGFSEIQRDCSFFSALTALALRDNSRVALMAFLLLGSVAVSLVVTVSREHSARMLKRENDSSAFLSHALKQKFSGVGGVIEHILEDKIRFLIGGKCDSNIDGGGGTDDGQMRAICEALLYAIHLECRKGEHACHALNVLRNIKQRTYRGQVTSRSLMESIHIWTETGTLVLADEAAPSFGGLADGNVDIELDWDLLQVFVCRWARGAKALHVECNPAADDSNPREVQIMLHLKGRNRTIASTDTLSCVLLAKELGGSFGPVRGGSETSTTTSLASEEIFHLKAQSASDDAHSISSASSSPRISTTKSTIRNRRPSSLDINDIPSASSSTTSLRETQPAAADAADSAFSSCVSPRSSRLPSTNSSISPLTSGSTRLGSWNPTFPAALRFAILDDNSLVRKNTDRICRLHLKADERSIARGRSPDECWNFPDELIQKKIDIAIVDENLDYERDDGTTAHISGRDIARIARGRGFVGCILCHSGQLPADGIMETSFDGYVQKTSSRLEFCAGIARNWVKFSKRNNTFRTPYPSGSSVPPATLRTTVLQ